MIEIKNIVKTYHPKKGDKVVALSDVSVKFPETGLVFILGKSGSGKSTLLNVLGGLDTADSGEIIIKGKSSKDFSQSDFDSYRNTYLGFVFQEYNILEDFNVGANVALALKLQGRKATDEEINEILEEVDLAGFGKRKPNELSGGQKQRVAIARALVKNPEIIMADEPTGALDSNTGIQVFDTLKKLSENKLVLVVSHDRDFAEKYGDRVIELKDGKIISDIEKHRTYAEKTENGLSDYGGKLLKFPKGYKLTQKDVEKINAYLSEKEAVLAVDDKLTEEVSRAARIDKDGRMETFAPTDEGKISFSKNAGFKLIKSRMPVKESFKMGASGLKSKPFRLVVTVLLCFVCFAMFGMVDSFAAYDSKDAITNSMYDSGIDYAGFVKYKKIDQDEFGSYEIATVMTAEDIKKIAEKGFDVMPVYGDLSYVSSMEDSFLKSVSSVVYKGDVVGLVEVDEAAREKQNIKLLGGRLSEADDEVVVSDYVFDCFKKYGYKHVNPDGSLDETKNLAAGEIGTCDEFLSREPNVVVNGDVVAGIFKIVGVFDDGNDYAKYEKLDKPDLGSSEGIDYYLMTTQLGQERNYGFSCLFLANKGFVERYTATEEYNGPGMKFEATRLSGFVSNYYRDTYVSASVYFGYAFKQSDVPAKAYYLNSTKTALASDEIALPISVMQELLESYYSSQSDVLEKIAGWDVKDTSDENMQKIAKEAAGLLPERIYLTATLPYESAERQMSAKIAGFFLPDERLTDPANAFSTYSDFVMTGDGVYKKFQADGKTKYRFAICRLAKDKADIRKAVDASFEESDGVRYGLQNYITRTESSVGDIIKSLAKVFLYVGIGVFVFALILFTNYISVSISYKRREIGILRAVGARSSDVFGVFFNEAMVIALIVFLLAAIVGGLSVGAANNSLRNEYNMPITLLNYGIRQVVIIFFGCMLTAAAASFVPVMKTARKKPIDAIRNH
ncbi:MAG: ABC transporter ATP-binding protein/permease [Eubacteriales bacterium]|nr:ABC transporter ATP-binding protein/permease [Eubacteriales bacterium]